MGTEYGLYDMTSKEFIQLGKLRQGDTFQLDAVRISKFLASRTNSNSILRLIPDTGELPDSFGKEWILKDAWHWKDGKPDPDDSWVDEPTKNPAPQSRDGVG